MPNPAATQRYRASRRASLGLSLIELLVGITLVSLLINQAIPSFSTLIERQAATQTTQTLAMAIRLMRHAAIAHQTSAILCPAATLETDCGEDWALGQLLFLDANKNRQLDGTETLIQRWPALPQGSTLGLRVFGGRSYLRAGADGLIAYQNGSFLYCSPSQEPHYARQLIFNALGRVRLATDSDGDGIAEDSQNRPLSCS